MTNEAMQLTENERQDMVRFFDRLESQLEHDGHEDMASEAAYWLDHLVNLERNHALKIT